MKTTCSQCGSVLERKASFSGGNPVAVLCPQCAREPGLLVRLVLKGFFLGMKTVGIAIMAFTVIRILFRLLFEILWF